MDYPIIVKNIADIRVRYAETDKMGFVYNGNYLTFFEVARVELMRSTGFDYRTLEKAGYQLPLIESHVNYKSPAYFDDLLHIETTLEFQLSPRMKVSYNIFRDNTTIAKGYTVHSYFNAELQRPVKPPIVLIEAMRNYIENKERTEAKI